MPVVLITGASSGLGAAFLSHYAKLPSHTLHTVDITPLSTIPTPLAKDTTITTHTLSVTDVSAVQALAASLSNQPIHLLIHSAGIRGLVPEAEKRCPGDVRAAETLEAMDRSTMLRTFDINVVGTFEIIRALLPNLRMAYQQPEPYAPIQSRSQHTKAKVIIMSSRMGSITLNRPSNPRKDAIGAAYAYRASKAALNAVVRSFAVDVPEVDFLLLHPGRVATGLVKWKEEGAVEVGDSVGDCVKVIGQLGAEEGSIQTGSFVDRWGALIEW